MKFTTLVPLALNDEGAKLAFAPAGRPLALKETLPVSPPTNVTVIVLVGLEFTGRETAAGETEMVKFGSAVTVSVIVEVSTVVPLVPVTVTVAAPTVAVLVAVNVSVLPATGNRGRTKCSRYAGRQSAHRQCNGAVKAVDR